MIRYLNKSVRKHYLYWLKKVIYKYYLVHFKIKDSLIIDCSTISPYTAMELNKNS